MNQSKAKIETISESSLCKIGFYIVIFLADFHKNYFENKQNSNHKNSKIFSLQFFPFSLFAPPPFFYIYIPF